MKITTAARPYRGSLVTSRRISRMVRVRAGAGSGGGSAFGGTDWLTPAADGSSASSASSASSHSSASADPPTPLRAGAPYRRPGPARCRLRGAGWRGAGRAGRSAGARPRLVASSSGEPFGLAQRPGLQHHAVGQHHHLVAAAHRGEPVRDDDADPAAQQPLGGPLHPRLGDRVEPRGGLVEDHHLRVAGPGSGRTRPAAPARPTARTRRRRAGSGCRRAARRPRT